MKFIGIDIATQSSRLVVIDEQANILSRESMPLAPVEIGTDGSRTQDPNSWVTAVSALLEKTDLSQVSGISISTTSGTFVLVDSKGEPIAPAAMYNDGRGNTPIERALKILESAEHKERVHLAHSAEFVIAALTGNPIQSIATDWSHAMKTGVDLHSKNWNVDPSGITLPKVVAPGAILGKYKSIPIYAGMTDGCTAQISAGGSHLGSAVSTLGTTLVLKVVSTKEVKGPGYYSHLLPDSRWLCGGASNLGGISFKDFADDIKNWDLKAESQGPASFVTYPLIGTGERFPIANKDLTAKSLGAPKNDVDAYRGILEGLAFAERLAYEKLATAGVEISGAIKTVGGGAKSKVWSTIRATVLNREVLALKDSGSDLGAAMIALAAQKGEDLASALDAIKVESGLLISPNSAESSVLEDSYQRFLTLLSQ